MPNAAKIGPDEQLRIEHEYEEAVSGLVKQDTVGTRTLVCGRGTKYPYPRIALEKSGMTAATLANPILMIVTRGTYSGAWTVPAYTTVIAQGPDTVTYNGDITLVDATARVFDITLGEGYTLTGGSAEWTLRNPGATADGLKLTEQVAAPTGEADTAQLFTQDGELLMVPGTGEAVKLARRSPLDLLKPHVGTEYTQQFAGFGAEEHEYLFYVGAGNEGICTEVWAVIDIVQWEDIKAKNYELRIYSDCGDVADLTDPDESALTARFPLRLWLGGTHDPDEPIADRIHATDGIDIGYLDPSIGDQVYIRLRLPVPFANGCLIQLWTANDDDDGVIPNQAELGTPHVIYCWARYQLGSLSQLAYPDWRLRAGIPGTSRVDTGWAQAGSSSWTQVDGDTTVTMSGAVYHEGAEATSLAVDAMSLGGTYAYLTLPYPVAVRDYAHLKLWIRADDDIIADDAVFLCASPQAVPTDIFELPDVASPIVLTADTWTEIDIDLADYAAAPTIWRSLTLGGTKVDVTFYIDDIRFIKSDARTSYMYDQLYTSGTTPGTWLDEASGAGMLVGVACAVDDPLAAPTLSALEENWSLKLNGAETYNWATSGFEDMFGGMAFYFDAERQIARDWGCLYKAASALEAYRWMVDNPLVWQDGAVGEIPVPTTAGSRANIEIAAVYYA